MSDFSEFLSVLKDGIEELAAENWQDYLQAITKDGEAFVEETKEDLERWANLFKEGKLTQDEFEWLVLSKRDLAKLEALKQEGLARVELDRFCNALVNLIVKTAVNVLLPA